MKFVYFLRLEINCITQYNAIQNPKIKNKTLEHCIDVSYVYITCVHKTNKTQKLRIKYHVI